MLFSRPRILVLFFAFAAAISMAARCDEILRYDGYVAGFKVAKMTIEHGVSSNSLPYHRFTIRSTGAARFFYRIESEMLCETFCDANGTNTLFTRRYRDRSIEQNDTMRLWPATGLVVREILDEGQSVTSRVEVGSQDVATFFCNIGAILADNAFETTNSIVRNVVLDGKSNGVVLTLGETNTLHTALGPASVQDMTIVSLSDKLFVRNRPKRIRLSSEYPVFLEMDVENGYGTQHFRLVEWIRNDHPFRPFRK